VTGYVLFVTNAVDSLGLNNLRLIRGDTLFQSAGETENPTAYSLYIALNYKAGQMTGGLLELQLTSLRGAKNSLYNHLCSSLSFSSSLIC